MELPALTVTFDDGATYTLEAKARDLLVAERSGVDLTTGGPVEIMYAVAHACMQRMQRAGEIPADVNLPATVDELAEVADIEGKADPDSG